MIVISDTAPLHYLVLIGAVEVLQKLAGRVFIPQAVYDELQDPHTPLPVKEWLATRPAWLEVRRANTALFKPQRKIGKGETEAIALALELQADALMIDDGKGIKEAQQLQIPTLRLLTLLETAAQRDLLDLPDAIHKLTQTNFHLPPEELIEAMLERDRQRRSQP